MSLSFRNFMISGVHPDLQRENYPADTVQAIQSTYDYSGVITSEHDAQGEDYKIIVVDGAIQIGIPKFQERISIQSILYNQQVKANLTAVGGLAGIGFSIYKLMSGDYAMGGISLLSSLGLTEWGMERACQAQSASLKWDASVQQICETRQTAGLNFMTLWKNDLNGSHFTADETQNIFHESMKASNEQYTTKMSQTNPQSTRESIRVWADRFIAENPMHPQAVKYAFGDQAVIQDPKNPAEGHWKRESFDVLAKKSLDLLTAVTAFKVETNELAKVYGTTQRETLFATRRKEYEEKFQSKVEEIFEEYHSTRQAGIKKC